MDGMRAGNDVLEELDSALVACRREAVDGMAWRA